MRFVIGHRWDLLHFLRLLSMGNMFYIGSYVVWFEFYSKNAFFFVNEQNLSLLTRYKSKKIYSIVIPLWHFSFLLVLFEETKTLFCFLSDNYVLVNITCVASENVHVLYNMENDTRLLKKIDMRFIDLWLGKITSFHKTKGVNIYIK